MAPNDYNTFSPVQPFEQSAVRSLPRQTAVVPGFFILEDAMIGAIETVYKGYRFRSRLEARWAVFFDELKIEYLYEPEGYILHDDSKYLPDFFLPNVRGGMWIEVKPAGFPEGKLAEKKLEMLCSVTDKSGMIVAGDPIVNIDFAEFNQSNGEYYPAWWICLRQDFEGGSGDYAICDGPYIFCLCPWCGKIGIEFDSPQSHT